MKMWLKMIKPPVMALLLVLVAGASAPALAMGPSRGGPGGPFGLKMLMTLDLSTEQRDQFADLIRQHRGERKAHRQQAMAAREKFRAAMQATPFDEENIRAAFQEMIPNMENGAVHRARFLAQAREILTDEQLAAIEEKQDQGKERMQNHRRFQERMLDTWLGMNDQ